MGRLNIICCIFFVLAKDCSAVRGGYIKNSHYSFGYEPRLGSIYKKFTRYSQAMAYNWTVSGIKEYRARFNGTPYYTEDPSLCYTDDLTVPDSIITGPDGWRLYTGYFVCPYNDTYSPTETYCCGKEVKQHCCNDWEVRKAGVIAGIVVGSIVGVGLIIFAVLFALRRHRTALRRHRTREEFQLYLDYTYNDEMNGDAHDAPDTSVRYSKEPKTASSSDAKNNQFSF